MILIVEGSNKVGKTTFIEKLTTRLEKLDFDVVIEDRRIARNKCDVTKETMAYETIYDFNKALELEERNEDKNFIFILDRSYLSEMIYGKLYRKYDNEALSILDTFISRTRSVCQLLITSNYNHIEEGKQKDRYMYIQEKFKSKVTELKSYYDICRVTNAKDVDKIVERYVTIIERYYGEPNESCN